MLSEYYYGVEMSLDEYLELPSIEKYISICEDLTDKKITVGQTIDKVKEVYRVLNEKLTMETVKTNDSLDEDYRALFPIKRKKSEKSIYLDPELVKIIKEIGETNNDSKNKSRYR